MRRSREAPSTRRRAPAPQAATSRSRKLPAGTFAPSARAASSSTSAVARVSNSGRTVGCWSVLVPFTGSASPQDSNAVWSGRIRSASCAVSSGAEAKLTVNTLPERSASASPTCGAL